jgi:hypothetical protein
VTCLHTNQSRSYLNHLEHQRRMMHIKVIVSSSHLPYKPGLCHHLLCLYLRRVGPGFESQIGMLHKVTKLTELRQRGIRGVKQLITHSWVPRNRYCRHLQESAANGLRNLELSSSLSRVIHSLREVGIQRLKYSEVESCRVICRCCLSH